MKNSKMLMQTYYDRLLLDSNFRPGGVFIPSLSAAAIPDNLAWGFNGTWPSTMIQAEKAIDRIEASQPEPPLPEFGTVIRRWNFKRK